MPKRRAAGEDASDRRATYKNELQRRIHKRVLAALGDESWSSLAERADIARSTVGSASQDKKPAYSIENLVKIARATGRPLEYFVGEDPPALLTDAQAVKVYREAVIAAVGALVEDVSDETAIAAFREIERSMLRASAPVKRQDGQRARDLAENVVPALPPRSGGKGTARGRAG